jgi:hypothetical protein
MGVFEWSLGLDILGSTAVVEGVQRRHGLLLLQVVAAEAMGFLCPLSFPAFPWHLGNPW